jgi:hypothetical protein
LLLSKGCKARRQNQRIHFHYSSSVASFAYVDLAEPGRSAICLNKFNLV